METAYTIDFADVHHIWMFLEGETAEIGNVLLASVPSGLAAEADLGQSGTAAIVRVKAETEEEAKNKARSSLENAITTLTYAFFRQAVVECHVGVVRQPDFLHGEIVVNDEENSRQRAWRRQVQGVPESSPDEDAGRVLVQRFLNSNTLPRRLGGKLARFVSDRGTQRLWQILSRDRAHKADTAEREYAESVASAAVYLRRSLESEPPHYFVDAVTGLESLFTPSTPDSFYPVAATVGYGVAYASFGRDEPSTRLATWRSVKELYGERSRLVHGDHLSKKDQKAGRTQIAPRARLTVERMLTNSIEFCLLHETMILKCGGINNWLDMARFGCPEALDS